MATSGVLEQAALLTRCYAVRAASVARHYGFLGSEFSDPTRKIKFPQRSYITRNPSRLPGPAVSIRRYLATDSSLLEDADNVYLDGLRKRIESGDMQMIDVRDASEIEEFGTIIKDICHIPVLDVEAALQLPDGEFRAKYGRAKPSKTDANIVFTCKKGIRSLKARDTARSLGYSKARHYPGGWMEWGRMNNLPYPKE